MPKLLTTDDLGVIRKCAENFVDRLTPAQVARATDLSRSDSTLGFAAIAEDVDDVSLLRDLLPSSMRQSPEHRARIVSEINKRIFADVVLMLLIEIVEITDSDDHRLLDIAIPHARRVIRLTGWEEPV
jgi:hypothetical protein